MTERLAALLDTLLPGGDVWPPGRSVALALSVAIDTALSELLSALPPSFAAGDEAALRDVEARYPVAFDRIVAEAYTAYYTDPGVRAVIERLTGYEARAPQPLGYALPPFDAALLDAQKRRAPFWRDPEVPA